MVQGDNAATTERTGEYAVVVPARSLIAVAVAVLATGAAMIAIDRSTEALSLLVVAFTAAVMAAPLVAWLARWMPRAVALLIVTVGGIVAVVAVVGTIGWDLNRQSGRLADALHDAVARLEPGTQPAKLARNVRLDERIDSFLDHAGSRLFLGSGNPLGVAALIGKLVVVAVLAAFLVVGGRPLAEMAVRLVRRASIRQQFQRAIAVGVGRAGSFLRRLVAVSICHGLLVLLLCRVWGLPGSITVGAWAAVLSLVPILGGLLAWAPIVPLAVVNGHPLALVVAVATVSIAADAIARHRWVNRALHLGPLLTALGLAAGVYLMGLPGALAGILPLGVLAAAMASPETDLDSAVVELVDNPPDQAPVEGETDGAQRPAVKGEREPGRTIIRIGLSVRTMVAAGVLTVALWSAGRVMTSLQSVLVWFGVAAFIGVGIDRPVSALQRKLGVHRLAGIAIVLGLFAALIAAVVLIGGPSITDSARATADDAPRTVASLERLPLVGKVVRDNHMADKVEELLASIPDRITSSRAADRIGKAAGDSLVGLGWAVTVMLAGLGDGPRLVDAVRRRIPVRKRMRAVRFGRAAYRAVSNVVAAAFFVAALNGTVVMMLALASGAPLAPILGLWAMFWNFIPQIGGFVGAAPLVLLAFGQGPWQGIIVLVAFISYQTFENHVLQPMVGSRVVQLPPLVVLVGALVAGSVAGFVGALFAGPILGVAKIAVDEVRGDNAHRIEDRAGQQVPVDADRRAAKLG